MKPCMNCFSSSFSPPCTSRVMIRSTIRSKLRHMEPTEFMQW